MTAICDNEEKEAANRWQTIKNIMLVRLCKGDSLINTKLKVYTLAYNATKLSMQIICTDSTKKFTFEFLESQKF